MLIENEIKEDVAFGINRLENFLKKCQSQSVKFSAEMAGLHGCFDVWKEHCRKQGMGLEKLDHLRCNFSSPQKCFILGFF